MVAPEESETPASLSGRQIEVLKLVATGKTSKQIGRELGISPSTVDNHIRAAADRLGATSRQEAARMAGIEIPSPYENETTTPPFHPFRLPPLGGRANQLTKRQRIYHVLQVAVVAIILLAASILTIAGVVHILG